MTEQEWLVCTDPKPMLEFLKGKASDRKLRLFAVACCRRIWKDLTLKPVRRAVETAEQYADGAVTDLDHKQAHEKGIVSFLRKFHRTFTQMDDAAYAVKIRRLAFAADSAHAGPLEINLLGRLREDDFLKALSPGLLRCIFGNPFCPVAIDPESLIPTVTALARIIYEERSFDQMPDLADALEAAGCTNDDVLAHCRGLGDHARGCWVVDLLIGKQ